MTYSQCFHTFYFTEADGRGKAHEILAIPRAIHRVQSEVSILVSVAWPVSPEPACAFSEPAGLWFKHVYRLTESSQWAETLAPPGTVKGKAPDKR